MVNEGFINPYAFLALPGGVEGVVRKPVLGRTLTPAHAKERLSGSLQVTWTLRTPMLAPLGYEDSGVIDGEGHVNIPGSSIKGLTRSLHEALFNGCLRVVDLDFVPGYRDPARQDGESGHEMGWRLALVVATNSAGQPTSVRLCEDEIWLDSASLFKAYGRRHGLPTTGDVVDFDGLPEGLNSLGRVEQEDIRSLEVVRRHDSTSADLHAVEGRVFLVTSVGARNQWRRARPGEPRKKGRCLWASGRLGARFLPVTSSVADDLRAATEGAEDRRTLRLDEERHAKDAWRRKRSFERVEWWQPGGQKGPIAQRTQHTGFLWPGDVVWVHVDEAEQIDRLRLSQLWRHGGRTPVRERMSAANHPCNPESESGVCLTCAIFGAVDATGQRGEGRQSAYAGHVRFGSARSTGPVALREVLLTPLGAPKPGSGIFYLQSDGPLPTGRRLGDRATEWGSEADVPPRHIRGRKFYWHTDPDRQAEYWSRESGSRVPPRYEAVGKQRTGEMARQARLVPAGTAFTATVTFDALDELSLHTLLWALDPGPLLRLPPSRRDATFAVHLGGGKPLGLGSATVAIDGISATAVSERYTRLESPALEAGTPQHHAAALKQRVGGFTGNLEPLARLLDLDGLGPDAVKVTYPPGAFWEDVASEEFRKSYAFFMEADGAVLARGVRPWHPLPNVRATGDVSLPIVVKKRGTR